MLINHHLTSPQGIEAKLAIIRAISFSMFVAVLSLVVLTSSGSKKVPYRSLSIVLYCYLGYRVVENIFRARHKQRVAWKIREDVFGIFDTLAVLIVVLCVEFSSKMSIIIVSFSYLLLTILYLVFSKTSGGMRILGGLFRITLGALGFQIVAQQTKLLDGYWSLVFIILWVYLSIHAAGLVFYAFVVLICSPSTVVQFIRERDFTWGEGREKTLATLWFILSLGPKLVLIFFIAGIANDLSGQQGLDVMVTSAIVGLIVCSLSVFFTFLIPTALVRHIEMFTYHGVFEEQEVVNQIQPVTTPDPVITLVLEKRIQYFIKLSESYFAPVHQDLLMKNTEKPKKSIH